MKIKTATLVFEQVEDQRIAMVFFNLTGAQVIDFGDEGYDLTVIEGTERDWDIMPDRCWSGLSEREVGLLLLELMNLN